jgi:hypothetical protein
MTSTWTVEATHRLRIRTGGRVVVLEPGEHLALPPDAAELLLARAAGKVRRLVGGPEDPTNGEVTAMECRPSGWVCTVKNGHRVPGNRIRSVAIRGDDQRVATAWMVHNWEKEEMQGHGLDGHGGQGDNRPGWPSQLDVMRTRNVDEERL